MERDSTVFGLAVLGVTLGLAVLLYGEAMHLDSLVPAGGVIVLASVGWLTALVARL